MFNHFSFHVLVVKGAWLVLEYRRNGEAADCSTLSHTTLLSLGSLGFVTHFEGNWWHPKSSTRTLSHIGGWVGKMRLYDGLYLTLWKIWYGPSWVKPGEVMSRIHQGYVRGKARGVLWALESEPVLWATLEGGDGVGRTHKAAQRKTVRKVNVCVMDVCRGNCVTWVTSTVVLWATRERKGKNSQGESWMGGKWRKMVVLRRLSNRREGIKQVWVSEGWERE